MPDVPGLGPLLSDDEFFAALDLARPGLRGIPAALAAGARRSRQSDAGMAHDRNGYSPGRRVAVGIAQVHPVAALEADSRLESTSVRLRFRDAAFLNIDESVL